MSIKRAQVLLVIVFAVILSSVVIFVLLLPVLSNLRAMKETTDTYQAIASAEAGLELELLNQSLDENTDLYDPSSGGSHSHGEHKRSIYRRYKVGYTKDLQIGNMVINLNVSTSSKSGKEYLRIDSEGFKGNNSRVLFIIFPIISPIQ